MSHDQQHLSATSGDRYLHGAYHPNGHCPNGVCAQPSERGRAASPFIGDAERAVLDAVHDTLCACRQPSGIGLVIPHGGEDAVTLAVTLMAQIERSGFRVVAHA